MHNQEFIEAVEQLRRLRVIKKDKDIADKTGYSKGLVSTYLSGRVQASEQFLTKFKEVYKIGLLGSGAIENGSIPLIESNSTASTDLNHYRDNPAIPNLRVKVPGFEDCNFATNVYGHSMYPTFESGAIIICKRIADLELIAYGECYMIVTEEQSLVKRILKHPKDAKHFLLAVSDNIESNNNGMPKYAPMDIPINKILDLFLIKGTVKRTQI